MEEEDDDEDTYDPNYDTSDDERVRLRRRWRPFSDSESNPDDPQDISEEIKIQNESQGVIPTSRDVDTSQSVVRTSEVGDVAHTANSTSEVREVVHSVKPTSEVKQVAQERIPNAVVNVDKDKNVSKKDNVLRAAATSDEDGPSLPYQCLACTKSFANQSDIRSHFHIPNNCRYNCSICSRKFNTKGAFMVHVIQHDLNRDTQKKSFCYECDVCNKKFEDCFQLRRHKASVHTAEPVVDKKKEKESKIDEKLLSTFLKFPGDKSKANEPSQGSSSSSTLSVTKDNNSNDNNTTVSVLVDEDSCTCDQCFDVFASKKLLEKHMELHKAIKKPTDVPKNVQTVSTYTIVIDDDDDDDISAPTLKPAPTLQSMLKSKARIKPPQPSKPTSSTELTSQIKSMISGRSTKLLPMAPSPFRSKRKEKKGGATPTNAQNNVQAQEKPKTHIPAQTKPKTHITAQEKHKSYSPAREKPKTSIPAHEKPKTYIQTTLKTRAPNIIRSNKNTVPNVPQIPTSVTEVPAQIPPLHDFSITPIIDAEIVPKQLTTLQNMIPSPQNVSEPVTSTIAKPQAQTNQNVLNPVQAAPQPQFIINPSTSEASNALGNQCYYVILQPDANATESSVGVTINNFNPSNNPGDVENQKPADNNVVMPVISEFRHVEENENSMECEVQNAVVMPVISNITSVTEESPAKVDNPPVGFENEFQKFVQNPVLYKRTSTLDIINQIPSSSPVPVENNVERPPEPEQQPVQAPVENVQDAGTSLPKIYLKNLDDLLEKKDSNELEGASSSNSEIARPPVACPRCKMRIETESEIALHEQQKVKCQQCYVMHCTIVGLKDHYLLDHRLFYCGRCEYLGDTLNQLSGHMKTAHVCQFCGTSHPNVNTHLAEVHYCKSCKRPFKNLLAHMQGYHAMFLPPGYRPPAQ